MMYACLIKFTTKYCKNVNTTDPCTWGPVLVYLYWQLSTLCCLKNKTWSNIYHTWFWKLCGDSMVYLWFKSIDSNKFKGILFPYVPMCCALHMQWWPMVNIMSPNHVSFFWTDTSKERILTKFSTKISSWQMWEWFTNQCLRQSNVNQINQLINQWCTEFSTQKTASTQHRVFAVHSSNITISSGIIL